MQSISSLLNQIRADYPNFIFVTAQDFQWSPTKQQITYVSNGEPLLLLHELAHAILNHTQYQRDIELLNYEREAWLYATEVLSPHYSVPPCTELVEEMLDTYRDWLHARSLCPDCRATGLETKRGEYKCISCITVWHPNEARSCALRRYRVAN